MVGVCRGRWWLGVGVVGGGYGGVDGWYGGKGEVGRCRERWG